MDGKPYLVRVEENEEVEGLIYNKKKCEGLKKSTDEDKDSDLNMLLDDSNGDDIGLGEEISVDNEVGNAKGATKGKDKGNGWVNCMHFCSRIRNGCKWKTYALERWL